MPQPEPLISEFADDTEMLELIGLFVEGIPETCERLRDALNTGNVETVRRIGHQMKGAGASYGYEQLTGVGKRLEDQVARDGSITSEVREAAESFVDHCDRVQRGWLLTK